MKRIAIIIPCNDNNTDIEVIQNIIAENEKNSKVIIDLFVNKDIMLGSYKNTNIIDIGSKYKADNEYFAHIVKIFKQRELAFDNQYYAVWIEKSAILANDFVTARTDEYEFPIYLHSMDNDYDRAIINIYKKLVKEGVQFVTNHDNLICDILLDEKAVVHNLSKQGFSLDEFVRIIHLNIIDELISVIVPVYNVESYLKRCVDTIIAQTYSHLEIILIDDGSKDSSGLLCDEIAEKDLRIKVVHQNNAGLSAARNSGLDILNGKYVFFVDSDDAIDTNTIEKLYYQLQRYNADIAACGYGYVDDDYFSGKSEQESLTKNTYGCWSGYQAVYELIKGKTIGPVAWNKLYKAELWKELRYPVGKIHEDEATIYKAIYESKIVVFVPENYYKYYKRANSIMGSTQGGKKQDYLEALSNRIVFFKKAHEKYLAEVSEVAYLDYLRYLYRNIKDKSEKTIYKKEYVKTLNKYSTPRVYGLKKTFGLVLWKFWQY